MAQVRILAAEQKGKHGKGTTMFAPCVAERYCKCGSQLQTEYLSESATAAVVELFDEIHSKPECGPVSPQVAAIARSRMTNRELRQRRSPADPREKGKQVQVSRPMDYDMLFPDKDGYRQAMIAGFFRAWRVPSDVRIRARDAWVEITDENVVHLRLLCKVGGWNRAPYQEGIDVVRKVPEYVGDLDETFNKGYASFYFKLPESMSTEARAEIAAQACKPRDLAAEAEAAKREFAEMEARV